MGCVSSSSKVAEIDLQPKEAQINVEGEWKRLHSIIRWNKEAEIAELKKNLKDNPQAVALKDSGNGNYPLHIAAQNGHSTLADILINKGADVNAINGKGNTPLHMAIEYDYFECSQYLVKAGADMNIANHSGWSVISPFIFYTQTVCTFISSK